MNWRNGLFRFWIIVSALWVLYWLYELDPTCIYKIESWCRDVVLHASSANWLHLAGVMLGGPVALLLFGWAIFWAVTGFRTGRSN